METSRKQKPVISIWHKRKGENESLDKQKGRGIKMKENFCEYGTAEENE